MYSFCSSTLKVQLILAFSLPICNTARGDLPNLCVLWQAELGTETFQSLILLQSPKSWVCSLLSPHLLMSSYDQTRGSVSGSCAIYLSAFLFKTAPSFLSSLLRGWVQMGFKTWQNDGCSAEDLVLLLPEKCYSWSSGGSLDVPFQWFSWKVLGMVTQGSSDTCKKSQMCIALLVSFITAQCIQGEFGRRGPNYDPWLIPRAVVSL